MRNAAQTGRAGKPGEDERGGRRRPPVPRIRTPAPRAGATVTKPPAPARACAPWSGGRRRRPGRLEGPDRGVPLCPRGQPSASRSPPPTARPRARARRFACQSRGRLRFGAWCDAPGLAQALSSSCRSGKRSCGRLIASLDSSVGSLPASRKTHLAYRNATQARSTVPPPTSTNRFARPCTAHRPYGHDEILVLTMSKLGPIFQTP